MPVYKFEIPDSVASFIRDELKTEPATYLQNELVEPIIKRFEQSVRTVETAKAEEAIATNVAEAKKKMKVKEVDKVQ